MKRAWSKGKSRMTIMWFLVPESMAAATPRDLELFEFLIHWRGRMKGEELGLRIALAKNDQMVRREISVGIGRAIRPAHFHLASASCVAQTEVKAQIVLRQITAASADFVNHVVVSHRNRDTSTDRERV